MAKGKKEKTALDLIVDEINKKWGKGSIIELDSDTVVEIEVIPTGSLSLDKALKIGGWPKGRIVEISGRASSGKTTMALHATANVQKAGGKVAFIDMEHALDVEYARSLDVDTSSLIFTQPSSGEQALDTVEKLIRSREVSLVAVDSVPALIPQAQLDNDITKQSIASIPRLLAQALGRFVTILNQSNTCLMFINQVRDNVAGYGEMEITPGGHALKFYSSLRVKLRQSTKITQGTNIIGNMVRATVTKNKLAAPFRVCEFPLIYGIGVSYVDEVIDIGLLNEMITKSGAFFTVNGEKLHGRAALRDYLSLNEEVCTAIALKDDSIDL